MIMDVPEFTLLSFLWPSLVKASGEITHEPLVSCCLLLYRTPILPMRKPVRPMAECVPALPDNSQAADRQSSPSPYDIFILLLSGGRLTVTPANKVKWPRIARLTECRR